jgi:hypothetical protein
MQDSKPVPKWALMELNLLDGSINAEKATITGRPNPHLSAVLDTGSGAPSFATVNLSKFPDLKKRLEDEGYL